MVHGYFWQWGGDMTDEQATQASNELAQKIVDLLNAERQTHEVSISAVTTVLFNIALAPAHGANDGVQCLAYARRIFDDCFVQAMDQIFENEEQWK